MRRLMWLSVALCIAVAGVLFGLWVAFAPYYRINEETYKRIEIGMTLQEVGKLIGGPPGDYGPGEARCLWCSLESTADRKTWAGQDFAIIVFHDASDRVTSKFHEPTFRRYRSHSDIVWQWLGLSEPLPTTGPPCSSCWGP